MKTLLIILSFVGLLAEADEVKKFKAFEGFGLKIGTKLSEIQYTEVHEPDTIMLKIEPPEPIKEFNQYYINETLDEPKRISSVTGVSYLKSIETCTQKKEQLTKKTQKDFDIYYSNVNERHSGFLVSKGNYARNTIEIQCLEGFPEKGSVLFTLTYYSTLDLPYFNTLFGITFNKKPENLNSFWQKGESFIYNYPAPKPEFSFENISLMVSPQDGKVRGILTGHPVNNKEICKKKQQEIISKIEQKYLINMHHRKAKDKKTLSLVTANNDSFTLLVRCQTNKQNNILLTLLYVQDEKK